MERQTILADRYEVRELLGRGGMGSVYLARDDLLGREVALKILKGLCSEEQLFRERFRIEAKSAASLIHPHIVSVFDAGETEEGVCYIAMEPVAGGTLEDRIEREGALDPGEAVRIASEVSCALSYAHSNGIVHRDVKPQNVLLTEDGTAKVADFGIAKAAGATSVTATDLILGTVRYLSPEQATGGETGPASDLYSLGVTLYEMLTGEVPFDAENPIAIAMKHVRDTPPSLRQINPDVPPALEAISLKLLSKDPGHRYASAAELSEDLERHTSGERPAALAAALATATNGRSAETAWLAKAEKASQRRLWKRRRKLGSVVALAAAMLGFAILPATSGTGVAAGTVERLEGLRATVGSTVGSEPAVGAVATVTTPPMPGTPEAPEISQPSSQNNRIAEAVEDEASGPVEPAPSEPVPATPAPEPPQAASAPVTVTPAEEPAAATAAPAPAAATVAAPAPAVGEIARQPQVVQEQDEPVAGTVDRSLPETAADPGEITDAAVMAATEPPVPARTTPAPARSSLTTTANPESPVPAETALPEPTPATGSASSSSSTQTEPPSASEIQDATRTAVEEQISGMSDR